MSELFTEFIEIKGAKVHNLKNISLKISRDKLTVITGLSGSGKSSLAFDTLYAEGQRRYVVSLSSYARQFLGKLNKPEVDYIKGIPPAIAVEQKVNTRNPRSTVGTSTEIYDYLKLLFARAGETFSPVSGKKVKRQSVTDVVKYILNLEKNTKCLILAPLEIVAGQKTKDILKKIQEQGFSRVEFDESAEKIDKLLKSSKLKKPKSLFLIIDRLKVSDDDDTVSRIGDSVQTALYEGKGLCVVKSYAVNGDSTGTKETFSTRFEADGIKFEIPTAHTFSFNSPLGACPTCEGYGKTVGIDEDLVVPNKNHSIYEDCVACWRGEKMSWYKNEFIKVASKFNFPIHKPYHQLSEKNREDLWYGNKYFDGLYAFFKEIESQSYKIQFRVMLSRYRGKVTCPDCKGRRLKKEASYVKVSGSSISELVDLPISELIEFFNSIKLLKHQQEVSKRLLPEIKNRLQYLSDVGLSYLTLNRLSSTLSGGESQRINLASSLGSSLVGSLYILDEPSIGLHSKDTELLIKVLKQLRDIGNTVVVVEHDEEIIRAADELIDLGPYAGSNGGEIVFQGKFSDILKKKSTKSLTVDYITGKREISLPEKRRKAKYFIEIKNANENNLKNIDVKFPLGILTVVSGVSGSGKSSLVRNILHSALSKLINGYGSKTGKYSTISGDTERIEHVEFVDQNPIGKSSRSNPVTYIKAFDEIRKLFAEQQQSKINGFKPAHFSFNVEGGRCEECKGEGEIKIEMQFMADVYLKCDHCNGQRFKDDVLDVKFKGKSIFDILEMTIDDLIDFFKTHKKSQNISRQLQPLADVGLGYVKAGQSSNTLSGGESQRIKLASFLTKVNEKKHTLFIFDEPTTGLHFHDIHKLLKAFNALIDRGNTIIVIEHNPEIIKSADYIIDLGPEGGKHGGNIIFEGTPEQLIKSKKSYTAKYIKDKIKTVNALK